MNKLISYKNDVKLKDALIREIEKHRKADAIEQGTYGKENGQWKGCAVACSLRSLAILDKEKLHEKYSDHTLYETKLGIPEWLARLEDTIFEGLPVRESKLWPTQFAKAIPVGVNLEPIKWKFCAFILKENIDRVLKLKISDELKKQVVDAVRGVLAVHEAAIKNGKWNGSAAGAAWSAAWSAAGAARSAAWSAESAARSAESAAWSAESAAWSAAWSAARSAESAAWSAAWSAARSAARSAESAALSAESAAWSAARSAARSAAGAAWSAESAAYKKYATHLLKLLREAK